MKKITVEMYNSFKFNDFGYKVCESGDYRDIKVFNDYCIFGSKCVFAEGSKFKSGTIFGDECTFGDRCTFGDECRFGDISDFGKYSIFGKKCIFGELTIIKEGSVVSVGATIGNKSVIEGSTVPMYMDMRGACVFKGCSNSYGKFDFVAITHISDARPILVFMMEDGSIRYSDWEVNSDSLDGFKTMLAKTELFREDEIKHYIRFIDAFKG